MSTYEQHSYHNVCEFTVRIKLNIPIEVHPQLSVTPTPPAQQKLPIYLEPDIFLKPEVSATPPVCLPQNGYNKQQLPAAQV